MAANVHIKRKLGEFHLDVAFLATSRRIGILGASGKRAERAGILQTVWTDQTGGQKPAFPLPDFLPI